jgi:uncharacterized protein (UPF0548 family)
VFLLTRPTPAAIARFLDGSRTQTFTYATPGISETGAPGFAHDEIVAVIGRGDAAFARAREALRQRAHFDVGWVEVHPSEAAVESGANFAILIRHLGFWSLNGCRIVSTIEALEPALRAGFAYGTLDTHAECGEEQFMVTLDAATGDVSYRLRAASRPRALLARAGYPIARLLQARFRRDSAAAIARAVGDANTRQQSA